MKIILPALLGGTAIMRFMPFDWKTIKVKGEDGTEVEAVALKDGNPIWVESDGTERTLGADAITVRNNENKTLRERAEVAETKLKAFEKITDPAKAIEALDTVSKLDAKTLIDAGEVDKVKESMRTEFQSQIDTATAERDTAIQERDKVLIDNKFAQSKFIAEKMAIPVDIVQATFGHNFKLENGKLVGYGRDGNKIMSKKSIGEDADFDEAISVIVENYPNRDAILKGGNHAGTGNGGGGGNGSGGAMRYSRAEFEKLDPAKQAEVAKAAGTGKAEIYD